MIHCSNCGKDFADSFKICPYCNSPAITEEMNDTAVIMKAVKEIYATYGVEAIRNKQRFISILRDYIPEYEKEMRLLITAINNNIVDNLSFAKENEIDSVIAQSRNFMENDMFLSKVAIDFILKVFTYMFGYDYKPIDDTPKPSVQPVNVATTENSSNDSVQLETKPITKPLEHKFFTSAESSKFRLKANVEIPEGYTAIKGFAFDEFSLLRSVVIPEGVVAIGEYAFSNCVRLTSVTLPSTLRFLKSSAFESCTKLSSIEIPRGVVSIEDGTFQFCENLEEIVIPNTVGSIGSSAFSCCENLKTIRIPDSVKYIGDGVFEYCNNVTVECYEYSYVHKYCQSAGLLYSLIKDND